MWAVPVALGLRSTVNILPVIPANESKSHKACRIIPLKFFFESCYDSRKKEGWTGLWRGITPRLSGIALQSFAAAKFDELVPPGRILIKYLLMSASVG